MAILPPVQSPTAISTCFEKGDHLYMTMPVQRFSPEAGQIEEYAFASMVKKGAPNENLVWFTGSYVEADNANANGAMWRADELAIKSLTPMLMPVTVMHDPRTAVGTIADVKLLTPEADGVPRARIDTVLALWGHRFPDAIGEAELNATAGTLMQSMEAYSPSYACSVCGAVYHKLPQGAEQAQWCAHLKSSNPSAGFVDLGSDDSTRACRILLGVTFTGTGLIFGSRGARGAYSEAYLESAFQDELAQHHATVHTGTSTPRSVRMGLVQIEESELANLRKERDDAKAETVTKVAAANVEKTAAEAAAEAAEAAKVVAETAKTAAEASLAAALETTAKATLKDTRWGGLGNEFVAKLGDFTKGRLQEQAGTLADAEWDDRLKELEETTAVKRDASTAGSADENAGATLFTKGTPPDFTVEELAAARTPGTAPRGTDVSATEQRQVIGTLGKLFKATA